MPPAVPADLRPALARHFGHAEFRPGQAEAVAALAAGRDVLLVHPTGAGKSLVYQLPAATAAEARGVALVVSPLIALMQDQVDALTRRGIPAAFLNSALSPEEQRDVLDRVRGRGVRLLYAAPERLRSPALLTALREAGCWLVACDEAHCISQWGHDFRPDYARIGEFLAGLGTRPAVCACTATATARVRTEIAEILGLRDPVASLQGIHRPNLRLVVRRDVTPSRRQAEIVRTIGWAAGGATIVYAGTRKRTEEIAEDLAADGVRAVAYHAGLRAAERAFRQDAFMRGDTPVVVATNAFGMGIDRADIRAVVHWRLPETLEAYYQEVGRAGRDGKPALCVGYLGPGDVNQLAFLVRGNNPFPSRVEAEWRDLRARADAGGNVEPGPRPENRSAAAERDVVWNFLERFGALARERGGALRLDPAWPGLSRAERIWMDRKREGDLARLDQVAAFAAGDRCRMLALQEYFGLGDLAAGCGHCDVCKPARDTPVAEAAASAQTGKKRRKRERAALAPVGAPETAADVALFERLRAWRLGVAAGKPAYTVCHDQTLIDCVRRKPRTMAELHAVHGLGPSRLARFGADLLRVLAEAAPAPRAAPTDGW